jgi:hypothetical protein
MLVIGISFNECLLQIGQLETVSLFEKYYNNEDDNDEAHQKHDSHNMKFICLKIFVFPS